ncbi:hypothetical protein COO60DRAFT_1039440 [Scenedesmus sp. NREL 46B-D3]|nr:hypothetical protein COO60DRAFT_1039440 [Scenedesmus sp. NREL 46B-D3]
MLFLLPHIGCCDHGSWVGGAACRASCSNSCTTVQQMSRCCKASWTPAGSSLGGRSSSNESLRNSCSSCNARQKPMQGRRKQQQSRLCCSCSSSSAAMQAPSSRPRWISKQPSCKQRWLASWLLQVQLTQQKCSSSGNRRQILMLRMQSSCRGYRMLKQRPQLTWSSSTGSSLSSCKSVIRLTCSSCRRQRKAASTAANRH